MKNVEDLLGKENLVAQDGEQKYYTLENGEELDKFLRSLQCKQTGELSQTRYWNRTNIETENQEQQIPVMKLEGKLASIEERLGRIESLLQIPSVPSEKVKE